MAVLLGAYENQAAGQSQDDGPTGGGFANEMAGVTVAQFNAISQALLTVYGVDTGPLVHNRPYTNERIFGRLDWQITDDQRLELTHQRLKENTVKIDDLSTTNQAVTGLNNFLNSGTDSKYYSVRLYSNWTDRLSSELRYARSNIRDIQDPVGGGEAQSDHPIVRFVVGIDNPPGKRMGRSSPARAFRARPTTFGPSSTSSRVSSTMMPATTS